MQDNNKNNNGKMENNISLVKNIKISGKIVCKTGLHVGAVAETAKIGGTDAPVILGMKEYRGVEDESKLIKIPIIPGSSLKGKMRSLLDLKEEHYNKGKEKKGDKGKVINCDTDNCSICNLFGRGAKEGEILLLGPTRLIIRDSFPTENTVKNWEKDESLVHGTEIKGENTINRITSAANPRFLERVPAGSKFEFEMIFSVYDDNDIELLKTLAEGMRILQDNYLGGSGSRGYGKIRFEDVEFKQKTKKEYENGENWQKIQDLDGENIFKNINLKASE